MPAIAVAIVSPSERVDVWTWLRVGGIAEMWHSMWQYPTGRGQWLDGPVDAVPRFALSRMSDMKEPDTRVIE